jgi:integrase
MARARNKLTARKVATLSEPKRHSDGGSLYLAIDGDGEAMRRRWLFFYLWNDKRREMGLGGFPAVSLADARRLRDEAERLVREGRDPIASRDLAKEERAAKPTFGEIADKLVAAKEGEWRNEKHRQQWRDSLTILAAPLRSRPVDEIDTTAILAVLTPLWREKPETASRLRGRIEAVLDAAKAAGHRLGENPATWRGHLSHLLPKRQKLSRGHHAAMAYADVPAFVANLRGHQSGSIAAMALEFGILTATRSGEIYGAQWSEIDMGARIWTVPAARMKAAREHRIPLAGRALAILEKLGEARTGELVFQSPRGGKLSHVAMAKVMRRLGVESATVHGFRSAFRDWAGTQAPPPWACRRVIVGGAMATRLFCFHATEAAFSLSLGEAMRVFGRLTYFLIVLMAALWPVADAQACSGCGWPPAQLRRHARDDLGHNMRSRLDEDGSAIRAVHGGHQDQAHSRIGNPRRVAGRLRTGSPHSACSWRRAFGRAQSRIAAVG